MKKITFSLLFTMLFFSSYAQFTFETLSGTPIPDGSVFTYGTYADNDSKLKFKVTNTTSSPIDIKIVSTSITNGDGTAFELCYGGVCNDNIALSGMYPDYDYPLGPGENNGNYDHFVNNNPGDGESVMEFVFSIYAIGYEENAITMTYRYDPALLNVGSFENLSSIGIHVQNTVVSNDLLFNAAQRGTVSLININGQVVADYKFTEGNQALNLNQLSSAMYLAKFTTAEGASSVIKIFKN